MFALSEELSSRYCKVHGCIMPLTDGKCDMCLRTKGKVVHCKRDKYDVYIGRPSIWGNPFSIDNENSREKVIQQYKDYLLHNPYLMARLPDLKGKVLGCWCKPEACHGDVILEVLSTIGNNG